MTEPSVHACDTVVIEAEKGFKNVSTAEHPWQQKLRRDYRDWKLQRVVQDLTLDVSVENHTKALASPATSFEA